MVTIEILPVLSDDGRMAYEAVSGDKRSHGRTAGEALDALTPQLPASDAATLVVVQNFRPDRFFDAPQQERLGALMAQWREARDTGHELPPDEQAELDALIRDEVKASARRATALLEDLPR